MSSRQGFIRGSLTTVASRLLDLPSRYGFHLLIAAELGVEQSGQFYIVFSVMMALSGLGRFGLDRALTRQIAVARAANRFGEVRRLLRSGFIMIFCASSVVSALLAIAAPVVARYVLSKPELAAPLALGALTIIPQNLSSAAAGALAGLQRVGLSQMIYSWLWPAIFCLVTLVMGTSIPGALILIALSFGSAALIGMGLLGYFLRDMPAAVLPPAEPALPLVGPGLSLFTLELTQLIIASAPAIILGIVASDHSVGLYAVAWRIALVTNITTSGVSSMATPRFAELYGLGDRAGLARAAAQSVGLGVGLALLPSIIMLTAPGLLLGFLGPGYEDGAMTLRILACGLLAATLFTAMPELLGMTGHMASLRRSNLLSLAVLLCLSMLLAPRWTNIGAAIATASAVLVNVAAAAWAVRNHLGITPLSSLYLSVRRWFQEISR